MHTSCMSAPFCSFVFFATFVKETVVPSQYPLQGDNFMCSSSPTLARFDFGIVAIKSRSADGMKECKNTQQMYTQAQKEMQQ